MLTADLRLGRRCRRFCRRAAGAASRRRLAGAAGTLLRGGTGRQRQRQNDSPLLSLDMCSPRIAAQSLRGQWPDHERLRMAIGAMTIAVGDEWLPARSAPASIGSICQGSTAARRASGRIVSGVGDERAARDPDAVGLSRDAARSTARRRASREPARERLGDRPRFDCGLGAAGGHNRRRTRADVPVTSATARRTSRTAIRRRRMRERPRGTTEAAAERGVRRRLAQSRPRRGPGTPHPRRRSSGRGRLASIAVVELPFTHTRIPG